MPKPPSLSMLNLTARRTPDEHLLAHTNHQNRILLHDTLADRLAARNNMARFVNLFAKTQPYLMGWVHQEVCDLCDAFVEAVEKQLSPRLIIQLPPRTGKSEIISRALPAYILGQHPEWEVVCSSYNADLAADFGRDVRSLLHDPIYRDLFPRVEVQKDSNSVSYVRLSAKGSYTAVGVGGTLTGKGAHCLLIDDPVKSREDADSEVISDATWKWYQSVARTRLAPGGGLIICQTRWSTQDLAGRLIERMNERADAEKFHVYSYPALATEDEPHRKQGEALHPERWPVAELEKVRGALDAREWSALYQQNPTPDCGLFFDREWFKWYAP